MGTENPEKRFLFPGADLNGKQTFSEVDDEKEEVEEEEEEEEKEKGEKEGEINLIEELKGAKVKENINSSRVTEMYCQRAESWNCNVCTFLNESSRRSCDMCGNENGQPRRSSRGSQLSQSPLELSLAPSTKNAFDALALGASKPSGGNLTSSFSSSSLRSSSNRRSQGGRKK